MCLVPSFHVPPATMVNRASVLAAPQHAAHLACKALDQIRTARYERKPEPMALRVGESQVRRGVAKLGFAWEAAHVRIFEGERQLAQALCELSTEAGVTSANVIVQDFARNDFELRQFVVQGKVVHKVYSNFVWTDSEGYLRDFVMKDRAEATCDWMEGGNAGPSPSPLTLTLTAHPHPHHSSSPSPLTRHPHSHPSPSPR